MGWKDLAKRLTSRFGLGDSPLITRRLYSRLEREVQRYGEPVMLILSECAEAASYARSSPGAWFRAAVTKRLRENGYLLTSAEEQARDKVDDVKRKVLAAIAGKGVDRA